MSVKITKMVRGVALFIAGLGLMMSLAARANGETINLPGIPPAQSSPPSRTLIRAETLYFDDWIVVCQEFAGTPTARSCSAQLQARQSETNRTVVVWTVRIDGQKVGATLQTLTGVMLGPGADLQLDNSEVRKFAYESCDTNGCVAATTLDDRFLHDAAKALKATVTIYGVAGNTIRFEIPIKGFDEAFAKLKANK